MLFNPHKLGIHKLLQFVPINRLLDRKYQNLVARCVNISDLRNVAKLRAHKMVFDYLDGGADDEISLRRNKDAYNEYELHFKVLAGNQPSDIDLSTTLFGSKVDIPFFGCPTAGNKMFHCLGEEAAATAANEYGAAMCLSSLSTTSFHDIVRLHNKPHLPKVFQLYVWKDRALVGDIIQEAKNNGFTGLVLTVDVTWMGNRERDSRNGFSVPPNYSMQQTIEALKRPAWTYDFLSNKPYTYACFNPKNSNEEIPAESMASFINSQITPDFSWNDAEWLLGEWAGVGNVAIKGVVRPEDAIRAVQVGFDTIWISNHGGRQLETSPATINVLPSIREAIPSDTDIIIDGGIQRGIDIVKAIAMGANGVGVGRPYLWGLTAGGTNGVLKTYNILKTELERAMGLLGTPTIDKLRNEGLGLIRQRAPSSRDYPDRHASERGYGGGII